MMANDMCRVAPDLLEAAKAALARLEQWSDFVPEIEMLRAAIQKAETQIRAAKSTEGCLNG